MKTQGVIPMAYCPLAQAGSLHRGILRDESVLSVAKKHNISAAQVLLAFVLAQENMVTIPRTSNPKHALENATVRSVVLDDEDIRILNTAFPAPECKMPLDIC